MYCYDVGNIMIRHSYMVHLQGSWVTISGLTKKVHFDRDKYCTIPFFFPDHIRYGILGKLHGIKKDGIASNGSNFVYELCPITNLCISISAAHNKKEEYLLQFSRKDIVLSELISINDIDILITYLNDMSCTNRVE